MESKYVSTKNGFSIKPPVGWSVDDSGRKDTDVIFKCDKSETDSSGNSFFANIIVKHIAFEAISSNKTDILDKMIKNMSEGLTNYHKDKEENIMIDDYSGVLVEQKFTIANRLLKNMQLLICYDNVAFTISATMLNEYWEKYVAIMRESVLSFRADVTKGFVIIAKK